VLAGLAVPTTQENKETPDAEGRLTAISAIDRLARHLQEVSPASMATVSDYAGVPRRMGARARSGRKVSATVYMLLCSALGLDALTGARGGAFPRAGSEIAWETLGSTFRTIREERQLNLRAASNFTGVSAATLSRAERGRPIAVESFLKIATFIDVTPESFLCFTTNTNCNTLAHNDSVGAPSVTAVARATS
jgi:hypothetical protein